MSRAAATPTTGLGDVLAGVGRYPLWLALGLQDIRIRYRRTLLGPFWLTLQTAVLVLVLALIYTRLLRTGASTYVPYLTLGLVTWQLIAALLQEGSTCFIEGEPQLRQIPLPVTVFPLRVVWRNLLIFGHQLLAVSLLALAFGFRPAAEWPLALLGVALIALCGLAWAIQLGLAGARFRDTPPLVASGLQVLFFASPVLWEPAHLGADGAQLADWNPMTHAIGAVRGPLLGSTDPRSFVILALLAAGSSLMALVAMSRCRSRLAYWL